MATSYTATGVAATGATTKVPTLTSIRSIVYRRLGEGTTVSATSELVSEIDRTLNDTLEEIYAAGDWWWKRVASTLTATIDQAYIALPSDFASLYIPEIYKTNEEGFISIIRDETEFQRADVTYTSNAEPIWGMLLWDNSLTTPAPVLRLVPTPDAAYVYTLLYRRTSPELTGGAGGVTAPNIPSYWNPAMLWRVTALVALGQLGRESAAKFFRLADRTWKDALEIEASMPYADGPGPMAENYAGFGGTAAAVLGAQPPAGL